MKSLKPMTFDSMPRYYQNMSKAFWTCQIKKTQSSKSIFLNINFSKSYSTVALFLQPQGSRPRSTTLLTGKPIWKANQCLNRSNAFYLPEQNWFRPSHLFDEWLMYENRHRLIVTYCGKRTYFRGYDLCDFPLKWQFRFKNESYEISRKSA